MRLTRTGGLVANDAEWLVDRIENDPAGGTVLCASLLIHDALPRAEKKRLAGKYIILRFGPREAADLADVIRGDV